MTQCSDSRLCNRDVLFNGAGACSDRTDDGSVQDDGYSAAEDDDLSRVAFLNAEERPSGLRKSREVRGRFIEDSGCDRLVDGEVDAADERAVLAQECHQVTAGIDHGDAVGNAQTCGLGLGCRQHFRASSSVRLVYVRGISPHLDT